jgi:hypothetical protein
MTLSNRIKFIVTAYLTVLVAGCHPPDEPYIVLDYTDFGPQAMAYELIGFQWWQWESHGDSNPNTTYNIKVIVYKDIPLQDIQTLFPIKPEQKQDYRYLEYSKALAYLSENLKDNEIAHTLLLTLQQTKRKIIARLGEKRD